MKRSVTAVLVVVVALLLASAGYAWWGGYGMGYYGTVANPDLVQKFQSETLSLRDALLTKQMELQNEYYKPVPDTNRIASIRKDIIDLQARMQAVAAKYGLPAWGPMGGRMMNSRMMGSGMMGPMMDMCPMGW